MSHQNHSEPENRLTSEEQQEFLELLARLSPEQREALKEVLKSFTQQKCAGRRCCYPAHFYFLLYTFYSNAASTRIYTLQTDYIIRWILHQSILIIDHRCSRPNSF